MRVTSMSRSTDFRSADMRTPTWLQWPAYKHRLEVMIDHASFLFICLRLPLVGAVNMLLIYYSLQCWVQNRGWCTDSYIILYRPMHECKFTLEQSCIHYTESDCPTIVTTTHILCALLYRRYYRLRNRDWKQLT